MIQHEYGQFLVEVIDEPTYEFGSSDNNFNYPKHYFGDNAQEYPTSKHGIKIYKKEQVIESCIIIASGGATGIHKNSTLIDGDSIVICCCDTVFCFGLPNLNLQWKNKADQATCFQVFKQQNSYIIQGEMQITELNRNGQKVWEFGGNEIFVSIDNEQEFSIDNEGILLTDFAGIKYKIDFKGKLIWKNDSLY